MAYLLSIINKYVFFTSKITVLYPQYEQVYQHFATESFLTQK